MRRSRIAAEAERPFTQPFLNIDFAWRFSEKLFNIWAPNGNLLGAGGCVFDRNRQISVSCVQKHRFYDHAQKVRSGNRGVTFFAKK